MGKFDGILICSDIDGTLVSDGKISDENIKAINYFESEGGLFTLCTGRYPRHFRTVSGSFCPNTYVIGVNGAQIYDIEKDELVYEGGLDFCKIFNTLEKIIEKVECIDHICVYSSSGDSYIKADGNFSAEFMKLRDAHILKVLIVVPTDKSEEANQAVHRITDGEYHVSRSWINGIEILSPDDCKGKSVLRVRKMLGDGIKTVVCVGDYENDISMLEVADIAFAVENAIESVKAAADHVTVRCSESAIAKIVEYLENHEK